MIWQLKGCIPCLMWLPAVNEQLVVELGLEETAARRLLDVCYARSDAWEKENGGTIYVR